MQRLRAVTGEMGPTCGNQPVNVFYADGQRSLPSGPLLLHPKRCPALHPPFVAIGRQDPISQFFVRNPREIFHKEPEAAVLDSTNELVRETEAGYQTRPHAVQLPFPQEPR